MVPDNAETARAWFDAMNRRDLDALLELMSPDVHFAPGRVGASRVYHGRDEVKRFFTDAAAQLAEPTSTIVIVEEVHAVADARTVTSGHVLEPDGEFVAILDFAPNGLISATQLYVGTDIETLRELGMI